jgi:hypothetical protein
MQSSSSHTFIHGTSSSIAVNSMKQLFFPDDPGSRLLFTAFRAEKGEAAAGEDLRDLFTAGGAIGFHLHFVVFRVGVTLVAQVFYPVITRFLLHH